MNIGLFYQSGYRIEACYYALQQFRRHYPTAPVALYEDNTDILQPVARKFNCAYAKTDKQGYNDDNSGRPAFNLETILAWLARVREACETTLSSAEWIVHFEDDVWFKAPLIGPPPFDLSGIGGRSAHPRLYAYLGCTAHCTTYGCGGAVFNREKFIHAYEWAKNMDWDLIDRLATDDDLDGNSWPRPTMWTDSALTVVFMHAKCSVGSWHELNQYTHSNVPHLGDRAGWPGTMAELEAEQPAGANVIHCWKPYYYPTEAETRVVTDELRPIAQEEQLPANYIACQLVGRLGNEMFQIAHSFAQARTHNLPFIAPLRDTDAACYQDTIFRGVNFAIDTLRYLRNVAYVETPFMYAPTAPAEDKPTIFTGFCQSSKFFHPHEEAVKALFGPTPEFIAKCAHDYPDVLDPNCVAINVRRGDYLEQPDNHPVVTLDYIHTAFKLIPNPGPVLIVSDDIPWCKENIKLPGKVTFVDYVTWEALWLLAQCKHFVISNSTFSWWGAYLGEKPDSVVVAPSTWFGPGVHERGHFETDIYQPNWIQVPTYYKDGQICVNTGV